MTGYLGHFCPEGKEMKAGIEVCHRERSRNCHCEKGWQIEGWGECSVIFVVLEFVLWPSVAVGQLECG